MRRLLRHLRDPFRPWLLTASLVFVCLLSAVSGAVYSVLHVLFLSPPRGVENHASIVQITRMKPAGLEWGLSIPRMEALAAEPSAPFEEFAAWGRLNGVLSSDRGSEQAVFGFITPRYFSMLGIRAHLGSIPGPEEAYVEGIPRIVISYPAWVNYFNSDPEVVGRRVTINQTEMEIRAVAADGFRGLELDRLGADDAWIPLGAAPLLNYGTMLTRPIVGFFPVLARVSRPLAEGEVRRLEPALEAAGLALEETETLRSKPVSETRYALSNDVQNEYRNLILLIVLALGGAGVVLSAAFVLRDLTRVHDEFIRDALGRSPGRRRLGRSVATVAVILAASATSYLGFRLASGVMAGLALNQADNAFADLAIPPEELLSAPGAAIAVLFPLLGILLVRLVSGLGGESPGRSRGRTRGYLWSRLVVGALSAQVVVVTAFTIPIIKEIREAGALPTGFPEPERVVMTRLLLNQTDAEEGATFYDALLGQLRARDGVKVALGTVGPFQNSIGVATNPASGDSVDIRGTPVGEGYFEAIGDLESRLPEGETEITINRTLAERLWPGEDPVGRTMLAWGREHTVAHVIDRPRCSDPTVIEEPCVWTLIQYERNPAYVFFRSSMRPTEAQRLIEEEVRALSSRVAIASNETLEAYLRRSTARQRINAGAGVAAGSISVGLLLLAVWAIIAEIVRARRYELSIRAAIGASRSQLTRDLLTPLIAPLLVGLGAGWVFVAFVLDRTLQIGDGGGGWVSLGAVALIGLLSIATAVLSVLRGGLPSGNALSRVT